MEHRSHAGVPESHRPKEAPSILVRLLLAFSRALRQKAKEGFEHADNTQPYPNDTLKSPVDAANEEARTKIWSIYVSEAERYDAALVESWKADMEGMLIFSGLFSASLTAFLIESYKTLQPDSGDLTVAAITQLSQQLAAIANGSTFSMPTPTTFKASSASVWCNALWFISLSLSLTCALLATLVEQWAREFLHKTDLRLSPVCRARVFSFLYFGLKNFRMHTVVDAIPFLLHASLLLFFVGLTVFLLPVNCIMMYLMCTALAVFIFLYTILTLLPLIRLHCPYRTPLSAPLWSLIRSINSYFSYKQMKPGDHTITEAVMNHALRNTVDRDQRALQWTLDSLVDPHELLPLVEAVPDLLYGPHGFREVNDYLFDRVLGSRLSEDIPSPLVSRIWIFWESTRTMDEDDPLCIRRRTACWKSLWALCMIPRSSDRYFELPDVEEMPHWYKDMDSISRAFTLLGFRYHKHMWLRHLHSTIRDLLYQYDPSVIKANGPIISRMREILHMVAKTKRKGHLGLICNATGETIPRNIADCTLLSAPQLESARKGIDDILALPYWSADMVDMVAQFIRNCMERLRENLSPLPYSIFIVCSSVLSHFKPVPRDFQQTIPGLPLSMSLEPLVSMSFSEADMCILDDLVQASLTVLPYIRVQDQTPLFSYLFRRWNGMTLLNGPRSSVPGYVDELALVLANYLQQAHHNSASDGMDLSGAVRTAVFCIEGIETSDLTSSFTVSDNFTTEISTHITFPLPPELAATQSLCTLLKMAHAINHAQVPPSLTELEAICQHELLRPRCPLFLPSDVDVGTVCRSLLSEIAHVCLQLTANFFENSDSLAWTSMPAFVSELAAQHWSDVEFETQTLFFEALLEFGRESRSLPTSVPFSVTRDLWHSCFGVWDDVKGTKVPFVDGIHPSCLRMLRETLEIYHELAETPHRILPTSFSQQLAQATNAALEASGWIETEASSDEESEGQSDHTSRSSSI